MTYVSKKEKVFDLPDQEECSSVSLVKGSEHQVRIFPSVCERGPTTSEECQKVQQLCGLLNGKESNGAKSSGFKYVPIDVLLTVLMAEKDAYIQELIERQEKCTCGDRTEVLFKASRFDDSEDDKEALIRKDAEVVALKNRNAVLESELEECRDTLRKAMHKLENVETIINENICLKEKLKYADEMIKLLEENKRSLEMELSNNGAGNNDDEIPNSGNRADGDRNVPHSLYNERDILKREIELLQNELLKSRASMHEMDMLKRQSETVLRNLQELSEENECYRKKLEAMKKLKEFVEELKRQAVRLAEKYERESQRANEQMKQLSIRSKELQMLREEKNGLQQKVIELSSFETEYYCLKNKLGQVELIMKENYGLKMKLNELDQLEKENERLRSETERLKNMNMDLNDSKNKMVFMEHELKSQENQIRSLTSKIQVLTKEYVQQDEYNRLRTEIQEKNDIIKMKEEHLKEIPSLKYQIEQLCEKLQKCMDDLETHSNSSQKLQEELDIYKAKCRELEELSLTLNQTVKETYISMRYEEKIEFKESLVHELENESYPVLQLRNNKMEREENDQSGKENEEEKCRNTKLTDGNLNEMLDRINILKELLNQKDERIRTLESDLTEMRNNLLNCMKCQDMKNHSTKLQDDILTLQEENSKLEAHLRSKLEEEERIEKLEQSLAQQKKVVECYAGMLKDSEDKLLAESHKRKIVEAISKMVKEEAWLSKKEISTGYLTEIQNLKDDINQYKKLAEKLREENKMLHKMKMYTEFTGKKALENVLSKLRAELVVLQNLSKPELESECQALHVEVKRLVDEADNLKQSLEAERKSKDLLEKKLSFIQKELSTATRARRLARSVQTQTSSPDQTEEIKKTLQDIEILKQENEEFVRDITILQGQCKDFQEEVTTLHDNMDEISRNYREERNITSKQKDEINALNEKIRECEKEVDDLRVENSDLNKKSEELLEQLTAKEAEIECMDKELTDVKNEMIKLTSEMAALQNRETGEYVQKSKEESVNNENSGETVIKVEKELDELVRKLENCNTREEKLLFLRTKRDSLIVKVNNFESEVDFLKNKLTECDLMRTELEQLKAERKSQKHLQMTGESEEKLLSDIFGLREQLKVQHKEIEHARSENTNLREQLQDLGKLLEACKNSHKTIRDCPSKTDVGVAASNLSMNDSECNNTIRVDSSTSCEKLFAAISIEEFKMEIAKMENKHKLKVQKLKEGNAEKIKKLIEQYEKESKNWNKTYNESLNNVKSYYENDIRKLVERHKSSILRLQNLHEDEVQELNTNYETQMEAMQTLNENVVNDLTSGAAEKCKLTEKYNREIKEVEAKFQKLLKEKENQYMIEIANLQNNLNRNSNDLKEIHKDDIENLSRLYEENMAQITEKHNRELKNCKKNNAKRTAMMKLKYEDLLKEERKKYEEQLQIMMERLKMGQKGDHEQDEVKLVYLKQKPTSHLEPASEFNKILQKILTDGLEALKFDELMLIHSKTCFTTENFFEELNLRMEREGDLIGDGCPHIPLLKEDKKQLLKRIFILEKEIAIKQLETHEAIINMETAEKCRIEELNTLLRNEREKNAELKILLTSRTRAQTDLKIESYMLDRQASIHETNFIEKVKELEVERAEKRCLEEELQKEKNNSKHLSLLLENERQRFKSQRKKDSEYIEAMRMRLEEALSHEQVMESQLNYEAQFRTKLELELQSLQRSFNLIVDQPQSTLSLEPKMVKDIKNLDRFESEKEENPSNSKSRNKAKSHKTT